MSSTYSTNLGLELVGTGDQAGVWGVTTNTNLGTLLEQAVTGYTTQAITDGADTVITIPPGATGVARNMYLELTGALTGARNLIVPASKKLYFIYNNTTGGFAVTVKVSGLTGVSVAAGSKTILVCNGTDIVESVNTVNSTVIPSGGSLSTASNTQTLTNKTISGSSNTLSNVSLTSAVTGTLPVANGGTGAATLTGYVFGNGTAALTASTAIPGSAISGNITGSAGGISGTVAIANGGTGATTAQLARNALAGGVNNSYFFRGDGTNVTFNAIQATDIPLLNQNTTGSARFVSSSLTIDNSGAGVGSGSVFNGAGPVTISYNTIGAYAATNPSGFTSNTGTVTSVSGSGGTTGLTLAGGAITGSGTLTLGGTLAIANGGTGTTTAVLAANAILPAQATNATKFLTTDGTNTSWAAVSGASGGTVTSVSAPTVPAFLSSSVATATTTPAITISYSGTALPVANGGTGATSSTGTGSVVLSTSPSLTTPALGTPSSGNLANCTFPTLNQPTTSTAAGLSATLAVTSGGTGVTTSTGTGSTVLSISPTLVTPLLGTPTSGNLANCTFPLLNQNTSGSAASLSATLAIGSGGTGATTATAAFDALAPTQSTNNGKYLTTNGTTTSWATIGAGGTVTSVTNPVVPAFLSSSIATNTTTPTITLSYSGTALPIANGGTASTTAQGAINTLAGGVTSGNFLRGNGTNIVLATLSSGDIPNNSANTSGTAAGLSATLAVGSGGTGQTSLQAAMNSLAGGVTTGNFLRGNGTNVVLTTLASGDIPNNSANTSGTAAGLSATLAVGSGGTGATTLTGILKGTGTTAFVAATAGTDYVIPSGNISGSSGSCTGNAATATTAGNVTGTVAIANGGTGATDAATARTNLGLTIGTNIPSPTGTGASGSGWNISITGSAATASSATTATSATSATTAGSITGQGGLATLNASQAETRNISGKTGTVKTLSTSTATGGADGDIWYQY